MENKNDSIYFIDQYFESTNLENRNRKVIRKRRLGNVIVKEGMSDIEKLNNLTGESLKLVCW